MNNNNNYTENNLIAKVRRIIIISKYKSKPKNILQKVLINILIKQSYRQGSN